MRIEIRCCCEPGRLLGTVDVPPELAKIGTKIPFLVLPSDTGSPLLDDFAPMLADQVTLEVAEWWTEDIRVGSGINRRSGLAIKSNDTPIETLRRIPGFVEDQS